MTIQAPPTPDTPPPAGEPGLSTPSRRLVLGAGIPAVLALGATVALGAPRPAGLGDATGDADLAEALAPHLKGHRRVAAALLDGTDVRHAGFGTDEHGQFEIGSLSKTFTGALVLDGVARGELALDSTVAEILGSSADSSAIADRTIAQLASHSAGIPGLPGDVVSRTLWTNALRKNPYAGFSAEDVIGDALDSTPTEPGPAEYSNLGAALEGQLAAYAADTPWVDLLRSRLLEPLGMQETSAPASDADLPDGAPRGHAATGHRAAPWTMDGWAPTGGIRSTGADLTLYLRSMIEGTNPGAGGLEPVAQASDNVAVGVNWHVLVAEDIVWHNGMTGGFASFCGWNRGTGRGVVLLTDTALSLDELAVGVLTGQVAS